MYASSIYDNILCNDAQCFLTQNNKTLHMLHVLLCMHKLIICLTEYSHAARYEITSICKLQHNRGICYAIHHKDHPKKKKKASY